MVIERFRSGARPIYERVGSDGRPRSAGEADGLEQVPLACAVMPDGVASVASWVTADLARVFQVMKCDDIALSQRWVPAREDLAEFEILLVIPGGSPVADAILPVIPGGSPVADAILPVIPGGSPVADAVLGR